MTGFSIHYRMVHMLPWMIDCSRSSKRNPQHETDPLCRDFFHGKGPVLTNKKEWLLYLPYGITWQAPKGEAHKNDLATCMYHCNSR